MDFQNNAAKHFLNKVVDFNPVEHMVPMRGTDGGIIVDEDDKVKMHLPVSAALTWFRLVYPQGKTITEIVSFTEQYAIFVAKVYASKDDPMDGPLSVAYSRQENMEGRKYPAFESAESIALKRALENAGFGCDVFPYARKPADEYRDLLQRNKPAPQQNGANGASDMSATPVVVSPSQEEGASPSVKVSDTSGIATSTDVMKAFFGDGPDSDNSGETSPVTELPPKSGVDAKSSKNGADAKLPKKTAKETTPPEQPASVEAAPQNDGQLAEPLDYKTALNTVFTCNKQMKSHLITLSGHTLSYLLDKGRDKALRIALTTQSLGVTEETLAALKVVFEHIDNQPNS